MKSYYEILGVSENASQQEIKDRYRKIALKMHPDVLVGKSKEEKDKIEREFQEVTNAYQTLSDESERRKYDSQRSSGFFGGNSSYSEASGFDSSS
jgi:DnaJ-class molecular chaperone